MTLLATRQAATAYTLALRDVTRERIAEAGAKAANLGDLARAGFPVPDGFVVTTAAFDQFLAANRLGPNSPAETVAAAHLPDELADALRAAAAAFGATPLAARSSAVTEDLAGASFAGQYETLLDVRGADALLDAVRHCWASAFGARVATYQAAHAQATGGARSMAVLVQRLVPAAAAGVAFTANPVTGDRAETVVGAVRGLGERLVSGQASPDEWVVRGAQAVCRHAPEGAIDADQVRAVANLARRVERHFGSPQDVEWALADGQLYLLQARPITALPEAVPAAVPAEAPAGRWERVATHYPQPLSPMHRSIWLPLINTSFKHSADEFGMLASVEQREIGGWVYMRLTPIGGKDLPAPPAWLLPLLVRIVPPLRSRINQCVAAIRSDKPGRYLERWHGEWRPELTARSTALRAVDFGALDDTALDEHLARVIALLKEGFDIHLLLHSTHALMLAELAFACRDTLGWDDRQTFDLLAGLSGKSTEPARRLAELARMASERPAVRHLLERVENDTVDRLAVDGEFAEAFADYQREYGCRALRYEFADLTLAETPALILGLIRDQIRRAYDPAAEAEALGQQRTAAVASARAALAGRSDADRARFERALARAEQAYPLREENEFYTVSAPFALVRYALLELGRRLAERAALAQRDDVFWLALEEARAALRAGGQRQALVAQRQAERAWVEQHPGPAAYGAPPGPLPALGAFPAEVRFALQALLWSAEQIFASGASGASAHSERAQAAGAALRGIAAAPGRYTGPARVIMSEAEFAKLQAGDVLVCPITSPVWSVLFPSVGALVTDTGGMLSHSAIIAREYRIPAVVAAANATRLLRDGQIVTVDGGAGLVEIQGRV